MNVEFIKIQKSIEDLSYDDLLNIKKTRKLTEEEKKRWRKVYRLNYEKLYPNKRKDYYNQHKIQEQNRHKEWIKENKEQQKQYRKDYWIKNREEKLKRYDKLKILSYIKLGGCKCAICGDVNLSHLTIDHINKDGNRERAKYKLSSFKLLGAIVKDTLTEEQFKNLRVLCWNHNKSRVRDYMDLPYEKQTSSQKHIHKLWKEAFNFFGPCKTCGETNLKFLSISHIHDDGAERRRNGEKQGPKLLSDFRKMGWPQSLKEDFCLECFTCNCSRMTKRATLISPSTLSEMEG